jgi:hypothetical protein
LAKAIGWVELTLRLAPQDLRPREQWQRFHDIFLVMPDTSIPRDALVSYETLMGPLQMGLDAAKPNVVRLQGETFTILGDMCNGTNTLGVASVMMAMPASVLL